MNPLEIRRLLTVRKVERETIYDVIGRMKVLLELFKRNRRYRTLTPFLKTYHLVTKNVAERSLEQSRYFKNLDALHHLDAYFANLYFRPMKGFLVDGRQDKPWQTYFRYCERKDGIPFLQMLLGVNAHINADLLTSVVQLHYSYRADFLKINKILREEIPDVMKFLAFVDHDVYGFGAIVFRKFVLYEFKKVIVNWRNQVWQNAQRVGKSDYRKVRGSIYNQTEALAGQLIEVFHNSRMGSPGQVLNRLNKLKVRI